MSEGLKELKEIELKWQYGAFTFIPNFELIKKELEALDIIKEKSVNVRNLIIYCFEFKYTYQNYVESFNYGDNYWELGKELLTEEEFNLLKEVLL